ncbi:MAG: rod shape-determining protein MreD [Calditrichaeota bacterium]|nr:MAG: rod shape-determining protein MreD [Calditrichota bacterium]
MNRYIIRYFFVFLGALLLQSTVITPLFQIYYWKPNLILIVLVIFSLHHGQMAGSTAGFLVGLSSDIISSSLLGLGALCKSITGYIAGSFGSELVRERYQFIVALFVAGGVHDIIMLFFNSLGRDMSWKVMIFVYMIPNLFYTAIVGTIIYYFVGRWFHHHE